MLSLKEAYSELQKAMEEYYNKVNIPYKSRRTSDEEKHKAKEILYSRCRNILMSCSELENYIRIQQPNAMSWQYLPGDAEDVIRLLKEKLNL